MDHIQKYFDSLEQILNIIGMEQLEREAFIRDFFLITEMKVIERIYPRLDSTLQKELDQLNTALEQSGTLTQAEMDSHKQKLTNIFERGIDSNEVAILYTEVIDDLMRDFLEKVGPSMTEEQVRRVGEIVGLGT